METNHKKFGLVGKDISYSYSINHFSKKFNDAKFENYFYQNFDIQSIEQFPLLIKNNPNLKGLNVTIPYKETVLPFLDTLSKKAIEIGAVNVIKFTKNGKLKGYNSDWYGFKKSLEPLLQSHHKKALILGTGGASKGVAFALKSLEIPFTFVSRNPNKNELNYSDLDRNRFDEYQIIINCTPLGTFPKIEEFPPISYEHFCSKHIAFDLIYNPEETQFLQKAKQNGAIIKNGKEMLYHQAEKSWEIWNR